MSRAVFGFALRLGRSACMQEHERRQKQQFANRFHGNDEGVF
jgi:hypothetical protein